VFVALVDQLVGGSFEPFFINYEMHPLINLIRFIIGDDTLVVIFDSYIFFSLDP
jgi:hypothetical protein